MARVQYDEIECKSALNRVSGMPFRWSLNPYRGCVHGCQYCYARATHPYLGFNSGEEFSTRIIVKRNMADVLRRELARPSWTREQVALGTATDAYQPCEGRYGVARGVLQVLTEFGTPVSVVTKSTLVWRDRDLLAKLAGLGGTRVQFTITTLDKDLWRKLEPGTPAPLKRLEIMRRLVQDGVPCSVFIAPVLPKLTDSEASIAAIAAVGRSHGATAVWAGPLRLAPLVKEHYLEFLGEAFGALVAQYERAYFGADAPKAYRVALEARIQRILGEYGYGSPHDDPETARESAAPTTAVANTGQLPLPW